MNTLKTVAISIVGSVIFALAVRTGFQAEKEAGAVRSTAH